LASIRKSWRKEKKQKFGGVARKKKKGGVRVRRSPNVIRTEISLMGGGLATKRKK